METIMITGFDPFGNEDINPSGEVARRLDSQSVQGWQIKGFVLPTVFETCVKMVVERVDHVSPRAILCIGQAGGRAAMSFERVAINVDDARIPDNNGNQPLDSPIQKKGPAAYFTTLPNKSIIERLGKEGIPAEISNTAGTYVCNHLIYGLLHHIHEKGLHLPAGFVHIPAIPAQVTERPHIPSMDLATVMRGVLGAVDEIIQSVS